MKVIIDTNILVSAVLRDRIPQDVLLFVSDTPGFNWIVSPEILTEYKNVLQRRKLKLPAEKIQEWMDVLDLCVVVENVDLSVAFERDPKDAKFLACALSVGADWFITGDKDFQNAQKMVRTTIISAALFKRTVIETWAR